MEPSGVWKNLLSGKQAVPTVACPSCGAQVPEFRIHSHLDTCLIALPVPEEEPPHVGEVVHELSDGGEQSNHRRGRAVGARGQGRGRGRGRKRREAGERKGRDGETGRKRSKHDVGSNVEGEKGLDAPAVEDNDDDDDDEYASFYQRWEYSVAGLDELGKARKEVCLNDSQKRELLSSGVLTVERNEVSAMVSQLDRLLGEFQPAEGAAEGLSLSFRGRSRVENGSRFNQVRVPGQLSGSSASSATADASGQDGTQSDQGKALEAWWEQWVTVEWPDGPLPSGFHAGLPPRLKSETRSDQDVHTGTEKVGMERSSAHETTETGGQHTTAINSILNFSESGGIIGGRSGVLPHSSEPLNTSGRREAIEDGMQSGSKTSRGEQSIPTRGMALSSHSNPTVDRSTDPESSAGRPRQPSSSTAPAKNPAETSGASPGLQACPICNCPFAPEASNREINNHIDQCLTEMGCQFD
ncbi:hypothetical protein KC19_2G069500 [Ceratodon purpureus]|uniref:UBZ4-type domain-containing protein n=1 Tax=Ceratodon purpureus TaxID=3225 RepID=A0A8T0IU25_CERPU|nr:hypothetical protein KC19_2G069500 [Ceratodon purpureus]